MDEVAHGNHDRIILATKVGMDMGDGKRIELKPDYIARADQDSLRRLQTETIDRLPVPQGRRDDAAGGGARRPADKPDQGRQGQDDRRLGRSRQGSNCGDAARDRQGERATALREHVARTQPG